MRQMKDSGVAWIGEIPEDWSIVKTKQCFDLYSGATPKTDNPSYWDGGIPWITPADYKTEDKYISFGRRNLSDSGVRSCGTTITPPNSIIFSKRAPIGLVVLSANNLCTNQGCIACVPKNVSSLFYYYAMSVFTESYELYGSGTTFKEISATNFANFILPLPSLNEQSRIATFLDQKCAEIDSLISLQEEMISELQAFKQSVITEAVTKGLDKNVKMKDSGVEWIGEIPEHWKLPQLRFVTSKIGSGSTPTGGANVYVNEGVKFLRSQNVYNEGFKLDDVAYITPETHNQMSGTKVLEGDILFNITGGSIGRCCLVDANLGEANVNQHVSIVRPSSIYGKYLMYYLQSEAGQMQVNILQTGGNREGLSASAFSEFHICVPSPNEQHSIATYLDKKTSLIDSIIALKQQKITELKDYKKSIIYECVTGKKEVV